MKTREEIDSKYKIDLTKIFAAKEDFYSELYKFKEDMKEISKYEGHLLDNEESLYSLLELSDNLDQRLEKLYKYAHIHNDCDLANKEYNEYYGNATRLYAEYSSLCSYIIPELLESDYSLIEKFISKNNKLKKYERMLKEIYKSKKHLLSKKEEYILSKLSNILGNPEEVYTKLTDVDLKFGTVVNDDGKEIELSESNWSSLIESKNREVRKNVFEKYINFLKLGCTKSPVESLKIAGIDLTDEKNYDEAFKMFDLEMEEFISYRKRSN